MKLGWAVSIETVYYSIWSLWRWHLRFSLFWGTKWSSLKNNKRVATISDLRTRAQSGEVCKLFKTWCISRHFKYDVLQRELFQFWEGKKKVMHGMDREVQIAGFSSKIALQLRVYWSIFSFRGPCSHQWSWQGPDRGRRQPGLLQPGVQPPLHHQVDRGRRGEAGNSGGGEICPLYYKI